MSKKKVFCFTHAGGNATFFNEIENDLSGYELVKLEYSGHGTRYKEPYYENMDELADDIFRLVKEAYNGEEYALFGYSMGTFCLVEVLKRILSDNQMSVPKHVFLAAHAPFTDFDLNGYSVEEQNEWIIGHTKKLGTIPEKLINNKSFWRMYLPLYRADYSIISSYYTDLVSQIPATVFYSETDSNYVDIEKWKNVFVGDIKFYQFEGSHFFIKQHHKPMGDIMIDRMEEK